MRRIGRGLLGLGTAILVIAVFMATLAPLAIAEGSDTGHNPVTICHRTDSETLRAIHEAHEPHGGSTRSAQY